MPQLPLSGPTRHQVLDGQGASSALGVGRISGLGDGGRDGDDGGAEVGWLLSVQTVIVNSVVGATGAMGTRGARDVGVVGAATWVRVAVVLSPILGAGWDIPGQCH